MSYLSPHIAVTHAGLVGCSKCLQRFYLKWIHWLYSINIGVRRTIRSLLGSSLSQFASDYNQRCDICGLINFFSAIVMGMESPLDHTFCSHLVYDILAPLHRHNGMSSWRDQQPILKIFHNDLVCAIIRLIEKSSSSCSNFRNSSTTDTADSVLCMVIVEILKYWPEKFETNTPKEILLLVSLFPFQIICNSPFYS